MSLSEFAALHGEFFLVKRPAAVDRLRGDDFEFRTGSGTVSELMRRAELEAGAEEPSVTTVAPVRKKPGNLWPNMISLGRTRNCDIPLRFPNVSKLHAIFKLADDGSLVVVDQGSANGTKLNGAPIDSAESVRAGDRLSFGGIECELMDASRLVELCRGAV
jgi:hypothetical protein